MKYIIINNFEKGLKWLSRRQVTTNLDAGREWLKKNGFSVIKELDEFHSAVWKSSAGILVEEPFDPCGKELESMWSCRFENGENHPAAYGVNPEKAVINYVLSANALFSD